MGAARIIRLIPPGEGREPERLYRIAEVQELLAVSRRTVFAMLADGRLDAVGEGRLTRIPASAITAYQTAARRSNRRSA